MNNNNQFLKLQTTLTEWLAKNKQTSPADIRIGLWGTSSSGKTVYLAILYKTLTHRDSNWRVQVDRPARSFVTKILDDIQKGIFPRPTEATDELNIFTYTLIPKSSKVSSCKIVLNFIDAPGEFYEDILATTVQIVGPQNHRSNAGMPVNQNQNNSMGIVDYLLSCHGIILLLDPIGSKEKGNSYWSLLLNLFLEFQERSREQDMNNDQLQQYMAFCVTKVDKQEIWSQGKNSADLAKNVMGEDLFDRLPNFCLDGRYEFFSVASIGRYLDKTDGKLKEAVIYPDIPDSSNTSEPQPPQPPQPSPQSDYSGGYDPDAPSGKPNTPPSSSSPSDDEWAAQFNQTSNTPEPPSIPLPTIKTDVNYEPFNVIKPIEWLIDSIQKNRPSRPQPKQKS